MKNYLLQTLINLRGDLIKVAKQGKTIPYKTLMGRHKIPRGTPNGLGIGWLIGYVSEYESEHRRPFISSIAVRNKSKTKLCPKGHPSPGFLRIDSLPMGMKRSASNTRALTGKEQKFIYQCQLDAWNYWKRRNLPQRPLNDFLNR